MFLQQEYQLIDFGEKRRLERFGELVLDRPCPVATGRRIAAEQWSLADARFEEDVELRASALGTRGQWRPMTEKGKRFFPDAPDVPALATWTIRHTNPDMIFTLKGSPFGHLGIFPEQSPNWDRIYSWCRHFESFTARRARVLNLFAYTGGSTLAAVAAGATVTHVDAAKNVVQYARENAMRSFGPDSDVRWIADDAVKYVLRKVKRDVRYDAIILDPPTYGHGARGEVWRFSKDIARLLKGCLAILEDSGPAFILLSCHVPRHTPQMLERIVNDALGHDRPATHNRLTISHENFLSRPDGARMSAGIQCVYCDSDSVDLLHSKGIR